MHYYHICTQFYNILLYVLYVIELLNNVRLLKAVTNQYYYEDILSFSQIIVLTIVQCT